jgi:subtilase family serine protease
MSPRKLAVAGVLGALALAALVAALAPGSSRAGTAAPAFKAVCSVGPIRCMSLIRTDIPAVPLAEAAHDGLGPTDLLGAYNLKSAISRGGNQTVAIVDAYDYPTAEQDLAVYRAYYHLPPCTTANGCFRKVNQDGEQGNYPRYDPDWELEASLDLDMVSAICPKCHILFVEASSADENQVVGSPVDTIATHSDLGQAVDTAVNLGATTVSNSYGSVGPESNWTAYDHYYNHPGVAITASSGDEGYGVIWPAASPYVTAVGGTSLTKAPGTKRGWSETAWGGATDPADGPGSGCSLWEPKPSWQKDAGCANRSVADVAAVADPGTGVAIYNSDLIWGGWNVVGGTSVASPIIASVYALAGNGTSVNYGSYPYGHTKYLNDITTGQNFPETTTCGYLCQAGKGYDGPTGLGTPNGYQGF